MHYRVVIFGVKDTTAEIVRFVQEKLCPVDLVVTIHPDVLSGNQVSGYEGLSWLEDKYGIPVYETHSYGLKDEETTKFFAENTFELGISMAGVLCLWMGVMEVMQRAGLAEKLARLLRPILRRLFPDFAGDRGTMDTIAANVSANLLGLGNAATPLGLEAARRMSRRTPGVASDSLCMLVVCNTASIQLIPTTVAAVRMAAGSATPFDILPAVWVTSALSVATGILAAKLLSRLWRS